MPKLKYTVSNIAHEYSYSLKYEMNSKTKQEGLGRKLCENGTGVFFVANKPSVP